jgi:hypothetical protein
MPRSPPKSGPGRLLGCVSLGLELIDELIELIEIDPGPEPEGMRNGLWCGVPLRLRLLPKTGPERPIDHILERQPELTRTPFQESGQIVIDGECGAHARHHECARF